ncbi:MAG TPA: SDR family NAD(P)-dependent oxidoreductase, partial [Bauldia sp.]|nr:SDR family NAD(P)-dependent oxidoreductase [Bauldia sp.]
MSGVRRLFDLGGRAALVTGASRGIGREIALALASAGADVAVTARSAGDVAATAADIAALGVKAVPLALDVRDAAACAAVVTEAADRLGRVDILD